MTKLDIAHEANLIVEDKLVGMDWDALRDHVDLSTGSELDCFQLDMLTDAVWNRFCNHA